MTDFLFIPATNGAPLARRVDFAHIAGLFGETEEPVPARNRHGRGLRIALSVLMMLVAIGDTILIARPDALAACLTHHASVTTRTALA